MKRILLIFGMLFLVSMSIRMWGTVVIDVPSADFIQEIVATMRLNDCILLSSIDVFEKKCETRAQLKQQLKDAIAAFRASKYINEISFQRLIDLIQLEIDLVHHLLRGDGGNSLMHVLDVRTEAIVHGTPSERYVYDALLNLGTYDTQLEQMKGAITAQSKNRLERELFLKRLLDTLSYYHASLRNMLYEISIHSRPGGHAIVANSVEDGVIIPVMFCPIEL